MIIAPYFYEIEKEDFEIVVCKIIYAKNFEKLTHRDILGALMSLGIKRELFGDIVEKDKGFYLAVDRHIYEYLKDHLSMIKRSKVKFVEWDEEIEVKNDYLVKSFIVSSFRLDKIISSFYKISRQKAAEFIRAGHVKVNHKPVEQINYLCNNKDIISFKKHGIVMFVDCNKQTRSDNYVVEGYFYKYGVNMMSLKKQVFGYNKSQVDELINEKDNEIKQLNDQIKKLQEDYQQLEHQKSLLQHRVNIQEQTNEEIARLALKEASELIDKAKKNANMILSESLEYVRSLSGEMSDFKAQAVKFIASVEKMSKDILESIDQSEVYNLINEDKYDEGDSL